MNYNLVKVLKMNAEIFELKNELEQERKEKDLLIIEVKKYRQKLIELCFIPKQKLKQF